MFRVMRKPIRINSLNLLLRKVTTTSSKYGKFRIQSLQDFDAHVRNSKVPVIVDFFAT